MKQRNFHDYRVLRMNEMPVVEAHIVPSTERMGGVGEPGADRKPRARDMALAVATAQRQIDDDRRVRS